MLLYIGSYDTNFQLYLYTTDVKVGDELPVDDGMVRSEVIEKIGPDVKFRSTDPGLLLRQVIWLFGKR